VQLLFLRWHDYAQNKPLNFNFIFQADTNNTLINKAWMHHLWEK